MEHEKKDLRATGGELEDTPPSDKIPLWQVLITSCVALMALAAFVVFLYGFWKHVR